MLFDGFQTKSEVERQTARVSSAAYRVQEAAEFVGLDAARLISRFCATRTSCVSSKRT